MVQEEIVSLNLWDGPGANAFEGKSLMYSLFCPFLLNRFFADNEKRISILAMMHAYSEFRRQLKPAILYYFL